MQLMALERCVVCSHSKGFNYYECVCELMICRVRVRKHFVVASLPSLQYNMMFNASSTCWR